MHACLAVTSHLHFWHDGQELLRATAVTRGGMDTEIRISTEFESGEENSPAAPAGIRTRDLSIF